MSKKRLSTRTIRHLAGVGLLVAFGSSPAGAQTDEQRSGARAAATAGGQAFAEGRWADSIDLFQRAESVIHSPVHLLFLARAYEKLGKLVKAHEAYLRITNEQIPASAPDPWRGAKSEAEKEDQALKPRLSHVSVAVQGGGKNPVTVTMDGVPLLSAFLGVPLPVDPGEHQFEAVADGMQRASSSVTVPEAQSETVVLALKPSISGAPPVSASSGSSFPAQSNLGAATAGAPSEAPPEADTAHGPSPLVWAAFGVGAVGLGVGTVFALTSSSKLNQANDLCTLPGPTGGRSACPDDKQGQVNSLDDSARSSKTIATVGFVAGGVGVAAGVTLLLVTPKHASATTARVVPWIGPGSAGVSGRF